MSWIPIMLLIVYIVIIVTIYIKYNKDEKPDERIDYYREILDINPSEAAFLCDRDEEGIYLILADILSLVNKGLIKLDIISKENNDKDYVFTKIKDVDFTKMKNHESMSYELFFNIDSKKDEIYLSEFLYEIENNKNIYKKLQVKAYAIKYSIKLELENQVILDSNARKKMQKINSLCMFFGFIIFICLLIVMGLKNSVFAQSIYISMAFVCILYNITDNKEDKITKKGATILEKCKAQRRYIKDYILVDDKPIYSVNILDYYYTMAIAFGMADLGRKEFYKDSLSKAKRKRNLEYIKRNKKKYIIRIIAIICIIKFLYNLYSFLGLGFSIFLIVGLILLVLLAWEKTERYG